MSIASFGEVLVAFRKRNRISQRALAEKLGVHRNTIGSWEQGNYLPGSKSMVLELARQLGLSDAERHQLLEASLTALSPHWSVPYLRNAFFTGREAFLDTLHQLLRTDQAVALSQLYALHGLGGIGKTQIALEYAYRYALEYSAVFWIEAETIESILASMGRVAASLQLPERGETDQQRIVTAVQHWLTTNGMWLLIWDNVEDLELLQRFLPPACQGATLITTHRSALGTLAQSIELPPMTPEEGMVFVLRRVKSLREDSIREQLSAQERVAQELVRVMGGLPLALDQAGAYIEETGCGLSGYLQRYEQQRTPLLDRRGAPGGDHPHAVTTTFVLAYTQVKQRNPLAAELLCLCAFLSAEDIPEELFVTDAAHPGGASDPFTTDLYQFDLAIATLRNFSLIQRQPATRTLAIHRLVQTILQDIMSEQERVRWQQYAIQRLYTLFPEVTYRVWEQCERLLPHVLSSTANLPACAQDEILAELFQKVADYLRERERHALSEQLYQQALCILEQEGEPKHPLLAQTLHGQGLLLSRQGKYEQARLCYERALHLREHIFGPLHPLVAQSLKVLGTYYADHQGRYDQAEALYQRALSIQEQAFGSEHPQLATLLNNLAEISRHLGKYQQAQALYERALRMWREAFGPDALEQWYTLDGLATLAQEQGKDEQAETCYRQALHLLKQHDGPEVLSVAYPLSGLALLACERGRYEEAECLYQRALILREFYLGQHHAETAQLLSGIAHLYIQQEKDQQAQAAYKRALSIQRQQLGQDHPDRAKSLAGLARLYIKQGEDEQAEPLLLSACLIFEQSLGAAHPETVKACNIYRCLLDRKESRTQPLIEEEAKSGRPGQDHSMHKSTALRGLAEGGTVVDCPEDDPFQDFLTARCELHPRAWSRASDLWQAYECWVQEQQERFPLSRRAFTAQMKALGCEADRTSTARIWRGIALVNKSMTKNDGR